MKTFLCVLLLVPVVAFAASVGTVDLTTDFPVIDMSGATSAGKPCVSKADGTAEFVDSLSIDIPLEHNYILIGDGETPSNAEAILLKMTQCVTIKDPIATSDHIVFRTPAAITISAVHCLATGGTSLTGGLEECDGNGANCAGVDGVTTMTCTAGTNVNDDGALSNASIDSGDYVKWSTASVSGTQTELVVCFDYFLN